MAGRFPKVSQDSPTANHRLLSAANTDNATLVQAGLVKAYRVTGFNAGAITYLKLYNKATAPTVGTDTPVMTLYLPANTVFNIDLAAQEFPLGLGYGMTTAAADNSTAAVASAAVLALNLQYK